MPSVNRGPLTYHQIDYINHQPLSRCRRCYSRFFKDYSNYKICSSFFDRLNIQRHDGFLGGWILGLNAKAIFGSWLLRRAKTSLRGTHFGLPQGNSEFQITPRFWVCGHESKISQNISSWGSDMQNSLRPSISRAKSFSKEEMIQKTAAHLIPYST